MHTTMHGRTSEEVALAQRYERARLALIKWRDRNNIRESHLAKLIGCSRSHISNFIREDPDFMPTPARPAKIRLLEAVEQIVSLSDWHVIGSMEAPPNDLPEDLVDPSLWVYELEMRGAHLADHFRGAAGLSAIGILASQAVQMTPSFRAAACSNVLLRMAGFAAQPESEQATPELETSCYRRASVLLSAAIESAPHAHHEEVRLHAAHCAQGYAGATVAYLSRTDANEERLRWAVRQMGRAAEADHEERHMHWPNYYRLLNGLVEGGHALSVDLADDAARRTADRWDVDPKVRSTLACTHCYPHLVDHWGSTNASLVEAIEALEKSDDT